MGWVPSSNAWVAGSWLCVLMFVGGVAAGVAEDAQAAQDEKIPTYHAYTNLVQIPVLVLGSDRKPMAPVAESRFFVSLDGGPKLRVTHARLEGDDPISLAILLDVTQTDPRLLGKIDEAIAGLVPGSLHANDRVVLYSLDCQLARVGSDAATDGAMLKQDVDLTLQSWMRRGRRRAKGDCAKPWHLWDSIAAMTQTLSGQSGRRVILAVTDGVDRGSRNSWNGVMTYAQERAVAVFGLIQPADLFAGGRVGRGGENPFNSVCELSGGMVLTAEEKNLAQQMERFVALIRGRYVVEFPRPASTTGGYHGMDITIEKTSAFIRPTGIGVPVVDPAVLKDPMTIPSDPTKAPQLGKRKVLTPN